MKNKIEILIINFLNIGDHIINFYISDFIIKTDSLDIFCGNYCEYNMLSKKSKFNTFNEHQKYIYNTDKCRELFNKYNLIVTDNVELLLENFNFENKIKVINIFDIENNNIEDMKEKLKDNLKLPGNFDNNFRINMIYNFYFRSMLKETKENNFHKLIHYL